MVYFVDLAVRGRGYPASFGSLAWCVFGFGGLAGTLLAGRIADRVSAVPALRVWYAIQVAALSAALWDHPSCAAPLAFAGGFSTLGLSVLALARTRELAAAQGGAIWVRATGGVRAFAGGRRLCSRCNLRPHRLASARLPGRAGAVGRRAACIVHQRRHASA
jgi:predicted MFS family arabinose efflux permease